MLFNRIIIIINQFNLVNFDLQNEFLLLSEMTQEASATTNHYLSDGFLPGCRIPPPTLIAWINLKVNLEESLVPSPDQIVIVLHH